MIAIVGLLVIGPEKLPKVARTLGAYTGRLQRYVSQVKEEVNREVRFEELQSLQEEIKEGANQVKSSILGAQHEAEETLKSLSEDAEAEQKPAAKKKRPRKASATVRKTPAKKTTAKKTTAKKTTAKKATVKKTAAQKATAKKTSTRKPRAKRAESK